MTTAAFQALNALGPVPALSAFFRCRANAFCPLGVSLVTGHALLLLAPSFSDLTPR